ncbi:NnrS family protein [Thalassotalea profundi]|uniref:Heme transporter CcmB n=1 Tax=Thalassotalea profundi TaxID=2036687 RepID=A0ABQ3IX87_9GAMM|nr:NnrS family protein [Thalassotalea profundi]GHE94626.1 heme transporter CcmB [Thalassotalea profundi]
MMQITDLKQEQKIPPILRLGFRPFFLFGSAFSVFSILAWLLLLETTLIFSPFGGGLWWHIHEMIFGFFIAIVTGFLLTAVQNWTGIPGIKGKTLLFLVIIWGLGRIVMSVPELLGQSMSSIIDLSFLPIVAFILAKPICAIKQYRNLFFVPLLLVFSLINLEMHLAVYSPELVSLKYAGYAGVIMVSFLISVMAGRVTPMFTANGTQTPKASPSPFLDKVANGSIAVLGLILILAPFMAINYTVFGLVSISAGITQLIRQYRWRPWITLRVPLLWSLHVGILLLGIGLIVLGFSYSLGGLSVNHAWHLVTIGAMATTVLAMIARVSLGHTGRPLTPPKLMSFAFIILVFSALVRSFAPWAWPEHYNIILSIAGLSWILSFMIFIFFYGPMMLMPRVDGRPG